MANYWIKLKHDVLTDPKMGMLNDRVWRLAIELFLLAGVTNKDGQLPSAADISWILRKDYATFLEDLKVLEDVGIIRYENSAPFVINFAKHQAKMPDAERKRKDREAARKEKEAGTDLSTDCPQNGQMVDTDKEEEREEETDKETDGEQKRNRKRTDAENFLFFPSAGKIGHKIKITLHNDRLHIIRYKS